jgi:hypothetical protein
MHFLRYIHSEELEMVLIHTTDEGLIDGIQSLALVICSLLTAIYEVKSRQTELMLLSY